MSFGRQNSSGGQGSGWGGEEVNKMLGRIPVRTECGEDINWKFTKEVPMMKSSREQVH